MAGSWRGHGSRGTAYLKGERENTLATIIALGKLDERLIVSNFSEEPL